MPDYGITETGFKRKRLDLLLSELNAEFKSVFGDNFNVSPESPDGQIIGVKSESDANLWEIAEKAYNAFNPSAATGATLSNLVQLNNIRRLPATSSRAQLLLAGTPGTVIPQGSLVSTSDTSDIFATTNQVTLDGAGNASVFAEALETGPIEALSGTITNIDTPIVGWATVTNTFDAELGTDEETDSELRARRAKSTAAAAQNVVDAIFAAISNLEGVTQAAVLENDTNIIDSNGQDPHSIQAVVVGGDDQEIVDEIFVRKPAGITAFGNTSGTAIDTQGISHPINFSRPTEVDIYVIVNLTVDAEYPTNGDDLIKQAIVDYANDNFTLAEDVIFTRLYTPINSVQGHQIDSLFIDITPAPVATANIPIAATEVATFTVANIEVNS